MSISKQKKIVIFLMVVVVLGLFFRVTNLDQKLYWFDETYTLLRSSSYTAQEASQNLFNGRVIRAEDILQYQYPSVEDRGTWGTIAGLATEEPQHPPLFFLLARGWAQFFGNSKLTMRLLPVLGSVLAFPAIYWLCLELSASPLVGWLTMALVAVSPIHVRYAQEVRQYSLCLTIILLACAIFLRAIRQPTRLNWGIYALAIAVGFYCHLLTGFVVIAHGLYVAVRERLRFNRPLVAYLVASAIGFACAFPWVWIVLQHRNTVAQTLEYSTRPLPFWSLFEFWCVSLGRLLVAWHFQYNPILIYLLIPIVALIIYAFYFFCRHADWKTWTFILILLGTVFLPFLIPDLMWGGRRSTYERYFLVCYVSIDLVIAYLLAAKLTQPFCHAFQHRFWQLVTVIVLSSGVVSCLLGVLSPTWWGWSEFDLKIAQMTNATSDSIVISDAPFGAIVPLCHELKRDTKLILLQEPNQLQMPDHVSHIFLYNPSDRLLSAFKQQYRETNLIYQFRDPMTHLVVSLYGAKSDSNPI